MQDVRIYPNMLFVNLNMNSLVVEVLIFFGAPKLIFWLKYLVIEDKFQPLLGDLRKKI